MLTVEYKAHFTRNHSHWLDFIYFLAAHAAQELRNSRTHGQTLSSNKQQLEYILQCSKKCLYQPCLYNVVLTGTLSDQVRNKTK